MWSYIPHAAARVEAASSPKYTSSGVAQKSTYTRVLNTGATSVCALPLILLASFNRMTPIVRCKPKQGVRQYASPRPIIGARPSGAYTDHGTPTT